MTKSFDQFFLDENDYTYQTVEVYSGVQYLSVTAHVVDGAALTVLTTMSDIDEIEKTTVGVLILRDEQFLRDAEDHSYIGTFVAHSDRTLRHVFIRKF
jgi:hypothetical protein